MSVTSPIARMTPRLDEAWTVASEMASDENGQSADRKSAQPRPPVLPLLS